MQNAREILDQYFLEMRYRCLSLAADLDRIQQSAEGHAVLESDARLVKLRQAIRVLLDADAGRAERVLNLFSDTSPPPSR